MPINATRFQFLDEETQVAVKAFQSDLDGWILNAAKNAEFPSSEKLQSIIDGVTQQSSGLLSNFQDIKSQAMAGMSEANTQLNSAVGTVTSEVNDAIGGLVSDVGSTISDVSSGLKDKATSMFGDLMPTGLGDVSRVTKGLVSKVTDFTKLAPENLGNFASNLAGGNAVVGKTIKDLLNKCSNQGMGHGFPGRPYSPSISCNGQGFSLGEGSGYGNYSGYGSSSCNASNYSDLLNKLSGGQYGSSFNDYNAALQKLMSISSYGYNMGLCGVFSALSGNLGLDKMGLSKGLGGLLGIFGSSGKTNAVLDLANASPGLNPGSYNPSMLSSFANNYKIPSGTGDRGILNLGTRTLAGMELLGGSWFSKPSGGLSLENICTESTSTPDLSFLGKVAVPVESSSFSKVMASVTSNRSYSASQLDNVLTNDFDFISSALS